MKLRLTLSVLYKLLLYLATGWQTFKLLTLPVGRYGYIQKPTPPYPVALWITV